MTMTKQNIFLDLGLPKHEAAVMLLRSELAGKIRKWQRRSGLTQVAAAELLQITAPRLTEILKNHIEKVSVDYLLGLCAKLALAVNLKLAA
jgi:predicted XRE-type DNA-binding protein